MAQAVFTHRPAATGIRDYTHTHRDIRGVLFRSVLNRFTPIFLSVTFTRFYRFTFNALPDLYDTNDTNGNAMSQRLSTVTTTSATSASRAPCPAVPTNSVCV